MVNAKTTIQIDTETKEKLLAFGTKGDTYQDIINRIYTLAVKEQSRQFLESSKNDLTLEEAKTELKRRWQLK